MRKIFFIILTSFSLLSCTAEKPAMVLDKPNQMAATKPKKITNKQNLPTVLFYYADWCPYCNKMAPVMAQIQQEFAEKVFFYFVDVDSDDGKKISAIYRENQGGIPCIQFFSKGGDFKGDLLGFVEYERVKAQILNAL